MKSILKLLSITIFVANTFWHNSIIIYATDSDNENIFQVQSSSSDLKEVTFEEANILSFEFINLDKESSEKYTEVFFNITNNGDKPVDYVSVDFSYLDKDGNQLDNDGRFNDFQVSESKSFLMKSMSDVNKEELDNVIVTGYDYITGDKRYEVDLQQEKVDSYNKSIANDKSFEEANIIDFKFNEIGINGSLYQVGVQINNASEKDIVYISFDIAYLDANGNLLDKDGRFNDDVTNPGNFVNVTSSTKFDERIAGYGIYSYRYTLSEVDQLGFNTYDVNLQTLEVKGSNRD